MRRKFKEKWSSQMITALELKVGEIYISLLYSGFNRIYCNSEIVLFRIRRTMGGTFFGDVDCHLWDNFLLHSLLQSI